MALHLGARAHHPQVFRRQGKALAAVERDRQHLALLGQPHFGRPRSGLRGCSHFISQNISFVLYIAPRTSLDPGVPIRHNPAFPRTAMSAAGTLLDLDRPAGHPAPLIDPFARAITYLRVSETDRCDFRCVYCMAENMSFLPKADLLSLEELDRLCSAFVAKGVRKLRLTGGEPLVRRGIMTLFSSLSRHLASGALKELTLTTNGSQLQKYAAELKANGVRRINISLDTLNADRFRAIT